MFHALFLCSTGPSTRTNIGPDKVKFNNTVTFTPGAATQESVSVPIVDDDIALEEDEVVTVELNIISPKRDVGSGMYMTATVTIIDDDCKFGIYMYSKASAIF